LKGLLVDFTEFMLRVEYPYWSPAHPTRYTAGSSKGWSALWPEDLGAFNLVWLLSGVSEPPPNTDTFVTRTRWAVANLNRPVQGETLRALAGRLPLREFAGMVEDYALRQSAQWQIAMHPLLCSLRQHTA
jgi:hypothetical protein